MRFRKVLKLSKILIKEIFEIKSIKVIEKKIYILTKIWIIEVIELNLKELIL